MRKAEKYPLASISGELGSGKTTLAQSLSSRLHIPHYNLDRVNWEQENALAIAEGPAWVTEGIYLIFTEPMLYHADYIIFLEISWPVAVWRIIYRHISNSLRGTNSYPGIRLLFLLLKGSLRYYLNLDRADIPSIEAIRAYVEAHREIAIPPTEEFVQMYIETYQGITAPPTEEFAQKYLETYKEKVLIIKNTIDQEQLLERLMKRLTRTLS